MKLAVRPIVICALGTIPKKIGKGTVRVQVKMIQITALLISARILRIVLNT